MNLHCAPTTNFASTAFNIGVHVAILFSILSVFFMVYISKVSSDAINNEITHNIDKFMLPHINNISKLPGASLLKKINLDTIKQSLNDNDAVAKENNKWLFKMIVLINVVIILFLIYTVFLLRKTCGLCLPVKDILVMNAVIFTFIGIVEYLFFTRVALKFIPVQPSVITKAFITSIRDQLN